MADAKKLEWTPYGTNAQVSLRADGILFVQIDTKKRNGLSASLNSQGIATSHGNQTVPGLPESVRLGFNMYDRAHREPTADELTAWAQREATKGVKNGSARKEKALAAARKAAGLATA